MQTKQRKVAIMGYRSVGKSSLTIQFVQNQFIDSYDPTIENTFHKSVKIAGQEYALQLVDTAGQDEYSILPQSYFMNIDGYILVYSVNSLKSFEVIHFVYEKLLDMKGNIGSIPIVLVGNKCDLTMEREVSTDAGRRLGEKWKIPFMETSAKEQFTVSRLFEQIIMTMEKAGNIPEKKDCVIS
ncbi:GTP-binding protein Rheb-like isoform X1 [Mya arenaria]|uniref:GTP-binding protein Rheb-like isoform X1 n=1 Tax=Mya arenaria TaxID=6604 RepID=UPI0022E23B9E|nr:GTP-binding protein Rheb-like isoform X1 [Mya arenaria]